MRKEAFYQLIEDLFSKSQVPLTRDNLVRCAGVASFRVNEWLDELVALKKIELIQLVKSEATYRPVGRQRHGLGGHTIVPCENCLRYTLPGAACMHCHHLLAELLPVQNTITSSLVEQSLVVSTKQKSLDTVVDSGQKLSRLVSNSPMAAELGSTLLKEIAKEQGPSRPGKKSLAIAGGLGLLGPLGWLYAGSLKEAIPAGIVFLLALKLIPAVFWWVLLFPVIPVSMVVGVLYAWKYNQTEERPSLLIDKLSGSDKTKRGEISDGS